MLGNHFSSYCNSTHILYIIISFSLYLVNDIIISFSLYLVNDSFQGKFFTYWNKLNFIIYTHLLWFFYNKWLISNQRCSILQLVSSIKWHTNNNNTACSLHIYRMTLSQTIHITINLRVHTLHKIHLLYTKTSAKFSHRKYNYNNAVFCLQSR